MIMASWLSLGVILAIIFIVFYMNLYNPHT